MIADVGLLGLPNAGKSTLISAVSAARPKIADYPFTTLYPNLGVISCGDQRSFVMADIPGLIEGAADGAGLGIRFLKHLQRTRVLLHLVDIAPTDPAADPVRDAIAIVGELGKFSEDLLAKPRWLVLNKSDLLPPEEAVAKAVSIARGAEVSRPGVPDFRRHACGHARSDRGGHAIPRDVGGAGAGQPAAAVEQSDEPKTASREDASPRRTREEEGAEEGRAQKKRAEVAQRRRPPYEVEAPKTKAPREEAATDPGEHKAEGYKNTRCGVRHYFARKHAKAKEPDPRNEKARR